ncbi:NERD domain-containing protein [Nocardioides panacisoli]|uniref:nuclease-related domain-containing protein n=1 Tax=Nocardioides panacisoli TaxID=627624 RepID=UPI001C62E880|nr:nuclease-related domain-containing protein [Nocardioides panacisoli]QYJ05400.1 NERD domain-containing protein [Nocardioides panacisoli]
MTGENVKQMRLRYAGTCRVCNVELAARTEALYERDTKTVRCLSCDDASRSDSAEASPPDARGRSEPERTQETISGAGAGASARREYERRMAARDKRVRERFPRIGGLLLAVFEEEQSIKAWETGAIGEEQLGRSLDRLAEDGIATLHDRGVPGTRANIDHLAVTSAGVWVIDAKKYKGRPTHRVEGGVLRPRVEKLMVAGRDRTKLVDGVIKQVEVVRSVVPDVPVQGALCFIDADWPLLDGSFVMRDIKVLWPKRLYKRLRQDAGDIDVEETTLRLHEVLRPA